MTIVSNRPPVRSGSRATEESTFPLDGGDIYICQGGPRDAPALLLIHGSGTSARSWDALAPQLTEFHRVIRIDLLGYGRSAKPADGDYAIPAQARRAGMVLDRLGVANAIVAGHSSGGLTATALAEERPDLVSALALLDTGPNLQAYLAKDVAIEPSQWSQLTDEQIRHFMSSAFSRADFGIPQQFVDDIRAMTYHSLVTTLRASHVYLAEQSVPERLQPLGLPLLVIFGADDRRWRSSSARDYDVVPGAHVEILPGLGHSPIVEDPSRTAGLLLTFAASHGAQAGGDA